MYLEFKMDKNGFESAFTGNVQELCSALTMCVNRMYVELHDDEVKGLMKYMLKKAFEDDVPFMETDKDKEAVAKKALSNVVKGMLSDEDIEKLFEGMKGL